MNGKSRPEAAPKDSAVAAGSVLKSDIARLCRGVIEDRIAPHRLPTPLHDLWVDGFMEGANQARARSAEEIARLEHDVNHWYVSANYSPAEIAEMRRKASYLQAHIDWETGVVA